MQQLSQRNHRPHGALQQSTYQPMVAMVGAVATCKCNECYSCSSGVSGAPSTRIRCIRIRRCHTHTLMWNSSQLAIPMWKQPCRKRFHHSAAHLVASVHMPPPQKTAWGTRPALPNDAFLMLRQPSAASPTVSVGALRTPPGTWLKLLELVNLWSKQLSGMTPQLPWPWEDGMA